MFTLVYMRKQQQMWKHTLAANNNIGDQVEKCPPNVRPHTQIHPEGTWVKSDKCGNPVNSAYHYGQWGQSLYPVITQLLVKYLQTSHSQNHQIFRQILSYILFNQILFEVNFGENYKKCSSPYHCYKK